MPNILDQGYLDANFFIFVLFIVNAFLFSSLVVVYSYPYTHTNRGKIAASVAEKKVRFWIISEMQIPYMPISYFIL